MITFERIKYKITTIIENDFLFFVITREWCRHSDIFSGKQLTILIFGKSFTPELLISNITKVLSL